MSNETEICEICRGKDIDCEYCYEGQYFFRVDKDCPMLILASCKAECPIGGHDECNGLDEIQRGN